MEKTFVSFNRFTVLFQTKKKKTMWQLKCEKLMMYFKKETMYFHKVKIHFFTYEFVAFNMQIIFAKILNSNIIL